MHDGGAEVIATFGTAMTAGIGRYRQCTAWAGVRAAARADTACRNATCGVV